MSVYLDTHITLSLYSGQTERLSKRAANLTNREHVTELRSRFLRSWKVAQRN